MFFYNFYFYDVCYLVSCSLSCHKSNRDNLLSFRGTYFQTNYASHHIICAVSLNIWQLPFRWFLLRNKLSTFTEQNAIICLQELSHQWIQRLVPFFASNFYHFVYDSEFLGTGIAVPYNFFKIEEISFTRVNDFIATKYASPKNQISNNFLKRFVIWLATKLHVCKQHEETPFEIACKRKKRLLQVTLSFKDDPMYPMFSIFTYHMPCLFARPDVMLYHARAVREICSSANKPFILCGDFNGTIESQTVQSFLSNKDVPNLPSLLCAHLSKNAPKYTNNSWTANMKEPFRDVIDYMFSTCEGPVFFVPIKLLPIRQDHKDTDTFPNVEEPSDHLPIGATFELMIAADYNCPKPPLLC